MGEWPPHRRDTVNEMNATPNATPAELERLLDNYDRTLLEYEEGRLTYEQAEATISAQAVFDGDGRRWRVNEHRQFVVDDLTTGEQLVSNASDSWVDPIRAIGAGSPDAVTSPGRTSGANAALTEPLQSLPPVDDPQGGTTFNRRLIIISVAVFVTIFLGVFFLTGDGGTDDAAPVFTLPPQDVVTTLPDPIPATTKAPSAADVQLLLADFLSGEPDVVLSVVLERGTPQRSALARSFWVGAHHSNIAVTEQDQSVPGDNDGSANGRWRLSVDGVEVATATVAYELDGTWKLAGWPRVAESA